MAALARIHPPANLPTSIVYRYPSLSPLYENNESGNSKCQCQQNQNHYYVQFACSREFQRTANSRRQSGHDSGEYNYGNSVANAPLTHLLPKPHEEYRASDQRRNGRNAKSPAWINNHGKCPRLLSLQGNRNTKRLKHRERNSAISRIPSNLSPSRFTLLSKLLQTRVNVRKELHDNGGGNVRHDANCKNRKSLERPPREHIEHVQYRSPLLIKQHLKRNGINSRNGNERTDSENNQRTKYEQQPLLELGRSASSRRRPRLQSPRGHLSSALHTPARCLNRSTSAIRNGNSPYLIPPPQRTGSEYLHVSYAPSNQSAGAQRLQGYMDIRQLFQ